MAIIIWKMQELANTIKKMQEQKFDCIIVFDGKRGLGKSTGAIKLALNFEDFKMKKDIAFSREDVINQLVNKSKGIVIADEMINVTYNRDFWSEDQKNLLKILNMYRDKCNLLIACVPNFNDLDKQFKSLVKIRINIIRRGLGILHLPNQTSFSSDKWDTKLNEKIEQQWMNRKIFKPNYARLTTFKGMIRFGDLFPKQRRIYEEIKQIKRNEIVLGDESEKLNDKLKKGTIYDQLLAEIKLGRFSREQLEQYCVINNLKLNNVSVLLNARLRDEGAGKTLSYYLPSVKKQEKSHQDAIVTIGVVDDRFGFRK